MRVSVKKIRDLCKEKGTSINRLERECGLSRSYIYKMPYHDASYTNLKAIADNLGVDVSELFEG